MYIFVAAENGYDFGWSICKAGPKQMGLAQQELGSNDFG